MLADDGETPVLMDFGSALPARIPIPDRRVALLQQDLAAEHCSMPFRAPELFDVSRVLVSATSALKTEGRARSSRTLVVRGVLLTSLTSRTGQDGHNPDRGGRHLVSRLHALRHGVRHLSLRDDAAV